MTFPYHRGALALILTMLAAAPIAAQGTAADSAHWRAAKVDLDSIARDKSAPAYSKRAQARLRARDSLRTIVPVTPPTPTTVARVGIVGSATSIPVGGTLQLFAQAFDQNNAPLPTPIAWSATPSSVATISGAGLLTGKDGGSVTVTARADTASNVRTYTITAPIPPVPPDTTTPPPSGSSIAAQPQNVPTAQYPTCTTTVPLLPGSDLQAAINSAQGGTCILLAPGGSWVKNYSLPNRPTMGYVTITTQGFVSTPGTRMTPSKAAALNLAKIQTPNYTEAIGTASGAHGYIFRGVEIGTTDAAEATGVNMLVRLTDPTNAAPPSDIQFQETYIHGSPTISIRRAIRGDGSQLVLADSWVDDIHSNDTDSQAWLGLNCSKGLLIKNNTLKAGHEIVMFGGGDPSSQACIPQDVVLEHNHITHPVAWYHVWQVKNCIETKDVMRYRIEANVIENCWPDAQAGFAFVLKSENQDCGPIGQYSTTSDLTIRYNVVINAGNGFNLSGKGSNTCAPVTAARFDIQQNVFRDFAQAPGGGQAIEAQFLSGVTDVQMKRNSFLGKEAGASGFTLDGNPAAVRLVVDATALHSNTYGVKGSGFGQGTATLNAMAPGYVWTNNLIAGGASCSTYPATTTCASSFPALPTATFGADTALVNRMTAGVVVADTLALSGQRGSGARPRFVIKTPWKASPKRCQVVGKPLPAVCDKGVQP